MTNPDVDVVVVGAGLAGLAAAQVLTAAGRVVTVLESGDAVGGRVRTDLVDGFRLDRGFQVLNTSYPALTHVVDLDALDVRPFRSGALIAMADGLHAVTDPRRAPQTAFTTLTAPIGGLSDKVRVALLAARTALRPADRITRAPETTTFEALKTAGISDRMIESFLRPFLGGVFCENNLTTSSRFFELVWRSFARGTIGLPAAGMQALPEAMAARLPAMTVRLSTAVRAVHGSTVELEDGSVSARAVLIATDPVTSSHLAPELDAPLMRSVTTYYHAAEAAPIAEATLVLDGTGASRFSSAMVLTNAAPTYSADGRALISTSVLGDPSSGGVAAVRRDLADALRTSTRDWEHVGTTPVPQALPAVNAPMGSVRKEIRLGGGRYVAGDHRDTPSIQGALVSGRRAAAAILADLG